MNFVQEERKETMIAVAENGEHRHKLVQVVAWTHCEGIRFRREKREDIG